MATYQDDLEEHLLVNLHELLVPLFDVGGLLAVVGVVVLGGGGVLLVVVAPLDDLAEDRLGDLLSRAVSETSERMDGEATHVHDGDRLLAWVAEILNHILDQHGALSDNALCNLVSICASNMRAESAIPVGMVAPSELTSLTIWSSEADMLAVNV